jgi:hypothetical protein
MVTDWSAPKDGQPRTWEGLVQLKLDCRELEWTKCNPSLARESAMSLRILEMLNTFEAPVKEEVMIWVYAASLQSRMSK